MTICAQDRACLFGDVIDGKMRLNEAGDMIQGWWHESVIKFDTIELDEFVIMPNHFHGIILIVGAALRGRPGIHDHDAINMHPVKPGQTPDVKSGQPHRVAPTLGNIVDWFKTMTTNEYIRNVRQKNWPPYNRKLWQRNYYEHIIRSQREMHRIREYIIGNPAEWAEDEDNPVNHAPVADILCPHNP